jgi:hypothetical protein
MCPWASRITLRCRPGIARAGQPRADRPQPSVILVRHMRLADRQLEAVLPDAPPAPHLLARSADTGVHDRYGRPEGHARALAGRWRRAAVPDLPSTPAASSRERARATSPGFASASHDVGGLRLAEDTSAPIGRITSFSAKFTDAPLAEGKFETYLHERENAKKPRAVRLSRPQLPMINCTAARRA